MPRRVFYSFYYKEDNWRTSQVRCIGVVEENRAATDNDWETITKGGDPAVQRWIDSQLENRSCAVVLIGASTAGRKWINYEIETSWNTGKGVLGINIHRLKDDREQQSSKGSNPFETFTMKRDNAKLSSIVKTYDPPYPDSRDVYNCIRISLSQWIEEAVRIRQNY
jgi:hypothetical protein